ncbi:sucrase ferredoxin family protein, partial [Streptomyces sp. SPB78]
MAERLAQGPQAVCGDSENSAADFRRILLVPLRTARTEPDSARDATAGGRPRPRAVRLAFVSICATASRALGEPLAGTAATARTWLLIEQPGPWGAKALTSSRLDPGLGRRLEEAARGTGVRLGLIRRPGRTAPTPTRRVFAAHVVPGQGWVHEASIPSDDAERLLALDLKELGAGNATSFLDEAHGVSGTPYTGAPLVCVCANGKRDRCCALLGRPLAAELRAAGTEGVWEVTHLGGHRFSPTLLVLPYGYAYGRA